MYTEKVGMTAKQTDPLLTEIKSRKDGYKENAIEAIIKDNTIIPGVSGKEVDVEKSYENMSKIGYFDDKLLEYKTLKVENPLDKNKDKYIINGNNTKKEVALVFKLKTNDNIENIIKKFDEADSKATFFINSNYLENNHNQIINLIQNDYTIGNLSNDDYTDSDFVWIKTIITNIGRQKYNYCFTNKPNKKTINMCKLHDSYTIMNDIISSYPLSSVKKILFKSNIIVFSINNSLNEQIELIINYIKSKGYSLVSLEHLLQE